MDGQDFRPTQFRLVKREPSADFAPSDLSTPTTITPIAPPLNSRSSKRGRWIQCVSAMPTSRPAVDPGVGSSVRSPPQTVDDRRKRFEERLVVVARRSSPDDPACRPESDKVRTIRGRLSPQRRRIPSSVDSGLSMLGHSLLLSTSGSGSGSPLGDEPWSLHKTLGGRRCRR